MMIPQSFFKKSVLVIGLGKTGLSVCRALKAAGATLWVADTSEARVQEIMARESDGGTLLSVCHIFSEKNPAHWESITDVVVSPGVPWRWPAPVAVIAEARRRGVPLWTDMDLFAMALRCHFPNPESRPKVIGVTGTNGKSTTSALMGHVMNHLGFTCQVGGNIGTAVLDLEPSGDVYVLELSSYQLELSRSLFLDYGVLLNIAPDHLERHGDMEGYIAAKRLIFEGMTQGGLGILNIDDAYAEPLYSELARCYEDRLILISVRASLDVGFFANGKGDVFFAPFEEFKKAEKIGNLESCTTLVGPHNWQNMLAVVAVTKDMLDRAGRSDAYHEIFRAMADFPGLAHRQESVGWWQNVQFVNDSKATNADATEKALLAFDNIFWIAGGRPKADGIELLVPVLHKIKHAFLIGEAAEDFADVLARAQIPYTMCHHLEKAVVEALTHAQKKGKGTVLLSPACASFDQFDNFEQRGDQFRSLVQAQCQENLSPKRGLT